MDVYGISCGDIMTGYLRLLCSTAISGTDLLEDLTVYIEPIVQGYIREDPTKYGLIWSSTSV